MIDTNATRPAVNPPARRGFVLARLATAVRRQDWFTVLVEIAVVVLGVVIGFQVNDWGQRRADRAKEQTYLRQLAADLRETEREIVGLEAQAAPRERSVGAFLRAFRSKERPPRDSLVTWRRIIQGLTSSRPVMGTVEALVATGDLALIRDDSLRAAITRYPERIDFDLATQEIAFKLYHDGLPQLDSRMDWADVLGEYHSTDALDSLSRVDPSYYGSMVDDPQSAFPFTVEGVLTDRVAYQGVRYMGYGASTMATARGRILEETRDLRERVEAELNRDRP